MGGQDNPPKMMMSFMNSPLSKLSVLFKLSALFTLSALFSFPVLFALSA